MKTTLNAKELKELNACADGYAKFKKAHGDKTVTLTQAFESNGWNDIWWYIGEVSSQFSEEQSKDLRLLAADYAERVLPIFEKRFPGDDRPRLAIKAARDFANGIIDDAARSAAWDAARAAARDAAGDAAWAAAWDSARSAAWDAARSAAGTAAKKWQEEELLELFAKWVDA